MPADPRHTRQWRQRIVPRVIKRDGGMCHLCDRPGAETADHVVPHSHGGGVDYANLKAAHRECNQIRGDRSISWARDEIARRLAAQEPNPCAWDW